MSLDWVNLSVTVEFRLGFLHKGCNYYGDKCECGEMMTSLLSDKIEGRMRVLGCYMGM